MRTLLIALLSVGGAVVGSAPGPSATGDASVAGERAYQKCYSCHAIEPGKNDLAGPSLYAIVGRPVASVDGFAYSAAIRRFAAGNPRWTRDLIDRYAENPEDLVPGTMMAFHGMPDPNERRALVDYLASLNSEGRSE